MAWVTLPSGLEIDTDHVVRVSRRTENLTGGGTRNYRTLHFDNNDVINLRESDIAAWDAALASLGTAGQNVNVTNSGDAEAIPTQIMNSGSAEAIPVEQLSGRQTWAAQTTTDANAVLGGNPAGVWDKTRFKSATLVIHNTGATNAATVTVEGSIDGTNWDHTILAATSIAAGGRQIIIFSDYFTHVRILIRATTATFQTTVVARAAAIAA